MRKLFEKFKFLGFQYFWQQLLDEDRRGDAETEENKMCEVRDGEAFALLHEERQVALFALGVRWIASAGGKKEKS